MDRASIGSGSPASIPTSTTHAPQGETRLKANSGRFCRYERVSRVVPRHSAAEAPSVGVRYGSAMVASKPRVLVVVPCYQSARTVGETVGSVLAQTYPDWRLVVVDDGSNDGPLSVVMAAAAGDPRVGVLSQPNGGVCRARNRGAASQSSEMLLFLDADDVLDSAMLETAVRYLDEHAHVGAVYTGHRYIDQAGGDPGVEEGEWPRCRYVTSRWWLRRLPGSVATTPFESIFLVAAVLPSLTVMRRSVFEEAGGWDEAWGKGCEDTDLFLRLALLAPVHHIPEPLVGRRLHGYGPESAANFERQYGRLTGAWRARAAGGGPLAETVAASLWFREHRFYPLRHIQEAVSALRSRRIGRAAVLAARAVGAYRAARPPAQLWWSDL